MVSDLLEEKEELLREAEQLKQRIADLEKEVIVWKKASENHSYRALLSEDKYRKQKEINKELVDENESLKEQIEKLKCCGNCRFSESDKLNGTFCHREGCFVVASVKCKLWENWEIKENV